MIPHVNDSKEPLEEETYDYEKAKEVKWYHWLFLNRPLKVIAAFLIFAILVPSLFYHFLFYSSLDLPPPDGFSTGSCLLPRANRLPCGLGTVSDRDCHPQCCYDYDNNMCFHRFPSRFSYILDRYWSEESILHPRISTVPFRSQNSIPNLRLTIDEISSTHLSLRFYSSRETIRGRRIENKTYNYEVSSPEFNINVNGTRGGIFSSLRGPLIASNNIWEMSFRLTQENMYGLGEIPLERNSSRVIYSHSTGLSSVPLIFAKSNGTYHGLLLDIKSPTEVLVQADNMVVVRSITTEGLKLHLFVGPKPEDVMRDVTKLIGFNKDLEYWMLGAHVCSDVSSTPSAAFEELTSFFADVSGESFPFESHCGTQPVVFDDAHCNEEDYVERGAKLVRDSGKRFVPHISPFIRYEAPNNTEHNKTDESKPETKADQQCSIIMNEFKEHLYRQHARGIYQGLVGEDTVVYPDYETVDNEFMKKLWRYEMKLEAVVLENNWPLDESLKEHAETFKLLPYYNEHFEAAFNHTPQWNISRPSGEKHIYTHNEYGKHFAKAFRGIYDDIAVASSSQWMDGKVIINRQNINASWTNLLRELTQAALGGISGHRLWSTPICGDTEFYNEETQASLCVKWYMAGTYMPMIKIHSKDVQRHPLSFVGTNRMHIRTALNTRLSLLPYFYTTLQRSPLLRPMFYQFPDSEPLENVTSQFSVGDDLVIVPNLQPSQSHVHVRMPPGVWYEFWSGLKLDAKEGEAVTMTTTDADMLTLIRGGAIVVMQKDVKETAEETRHNSDFSLTIALECKNNTQSVLECSAEGNLFINKDLSLNFHVDDDTLVITAEGNDFKALCGGNDAVWARNIKEINTYGLRDQFNNYDNHRHQESSIDLCVLEESSTMALNYLT